MTAHAQPLTLLDTTLRDGSYVVDFQFTARDTARIAGALDACGVPFIEVGHGVGLRASENPSMRAACTDAEYFAAAAAVVTRGKWGVFAIPGIARIEDVDAAAQAGAGFIRIGTNVTEAETAAPFIARAKSHGLHVSANYMKTYALPPEAVGAAARRSAEAGADLVCVVDSAGGMLPEDVTAYVHGIQAVSDVPVGFHGHNNLGLAIANSLAAVEAGVAMVDTSLRGMGRSAGNAATEIFLLALKRRGGDLGLDPLALMDIAERHVDDMLRHYQQVDSIGIISGYAQFHSSFLGTVLAHAERHRVDPRELIVAVTREDKVNAPTELVEALARELASRNQVPQPAAVVVPGRRVAGAASVAERARQVAEDARTAARRMGKRAVFNLVQAVRPPGETAVSSAVYEGAQFVVASAETQDATAAAEMAHAVLPLVDHVLLDADVKGAWSRPLLAAVEAACNGASLLRYSDTEAWGRALVSRVLHEARAIEGVAVIGDGPLADPCRLRLSLAGCAAASADTAPVVLVLAPATVAPRPTLALVVDGLLGALAAPALDALHAAGVAVVRPDMRVAIHAEIGAALGARTFFETVQGRATVDGVPVAAGGVLAPRGTVIVDAARAPHHVLGVADGRGLLVPAAELDEAERAALLRVEHAMEHAAAAGRAATARAE